MMEVHWKKVRKGLLLSLLLWLILGELAGDLGGIIGFILATLFVGYRVGEGYKSGALHGALVGLVGGIIGGSVIGILYILGLGSTAQALWPVTGIVEAILIIILYGVFGAISGAVGSIIKKSV
ncbi:DUF5518 domain-containing protein [Methanobacterium alkalithermotolerans]|uniref:DUF5518 domain-containing protein n=1 Tax=Methanobacterium alkalithermotolerans TaxID=2731220 RepID=A0A8T8KAD1_9EURY|nr:DUF5518 domain-containing protein [Methanobacterium alkalithermotolerans]QUH22381.1 DUF5518 domain-containing protein [Methanobacterium alkalithermotolerans]